MKIVYTDHAKIRLKQRKISRKDINIALENPDVIVSRKDATTLIQKRSKIGTLEIVCKKSHTTTVIITAYRL